MYLFQVPSRCLTNKLNEKVAVRERLDEVSFSNVGKHRFEG